jgi:hypothetical protein
MGSEGIQEEYDRLQEMTGRQFGKLLQEVAKEAIDSAKNQD